MIIDFMKKNIALIFNSNVTKSALWLTIGNIILKSSSFISMPIFTRIMSTSDFGYYNSFVALEGILVFFVGLSLHVSIRNAKFDYKDEFENYVSNIVFVSIFILLFFLVLVNIFNDIICDITNFNRFANNLLVIYSFTSFVILVMNLKYTMDFQYKKFLVLSAIITIGSIILSILFISINMFDSTFLSRAFATVLVQFIVALFLCITKFKNNFIFKKNYILYGLRISLPMIPNGLAQVLLSQCDRLMILNMINSEISGIYSFASTISSISRILLNSLENTWSAWCFGKINQNDNEVIIKRTNQYILFFNILSIVLIFLAPIFIIILATSEYYIGCQTAILLTLSNLFIFDYTILACYEYYYKKNTLIAISTITCAVFNVVFNYFAISNFGFIGASWITLIAYILLFLYHLIIVIKMKIRTIDYKYLLTTSIFTLLITIIYYFSYNKSLIFNMLLFVISTVFIIIFYFCQNNHYKNRKGH